MANKNTHVSVNTFEKYYKSYDRSDAVVTISNGDAEMTFTVKRSVDLSAFGAAVEAAAEGCFKDGVYRAWMRDYSMRHVIIATYTNISLPANPNKEFDFLMGTDVYYQVIDKIDPTQREMLEVSIDEQIEALADRYSSSREQELDQALTMLKLVAQKYHEVITLCNSIAGDDIRELAARLQNSAHDVTDEVAAIREKVEATRASAAPSTNQAGEAVIESM